MRHRKVHSTSKMGPSNLLSHVLAVACACTVANGRGLGAVQVPVRRYVPSDTPAGFQTELDNVYVNQTVRAMVTGVRHTACRGVGRVVWMLVPPGPSSGLEMIARGVACYSVLSLPSTCAPPPPPPPPPPSPPPPPPCRCPCRQRRRRSCSSTSGTTTPTLCSPRTRPVGATCVACSRTHRHLSRQTHTHPSIHPSAHTLSSHAGWFHGTRPSQGRHLLAAPRLWRQVRRQRCVPRSASPTPLPIGRAAPARSPPRRVPTGAAVAPAPRGRAPPRPVHHPRAERGARMGQHHRPPRRGEARERPCLRRTGLARAPRAGHFFPYSRTAKALCTTRLAPHPRGVKGAWRKACSCGVTCPITSPDAGPHHRGERDQGQLLPVRQSLGTRAAVWRHPGHESSSASPPRVRVRLRAHHHRDAVSWAWR